MKFSMVNEVSTFLVITQVSSGYKKSHILIFSKYKCLHVKIASLPVQLVLPSLPVQLVLLLQLVQPSLNSTTSTTITTAMTSTNTTTGRTSTDISNKDVYTPQYIP